MYNKVLKYNFVETQLDIRHANIQGSEETYYNTVLS